MEGLKKRMGSENVETATIGNYFEDFCCEGEQRMGQILEENVRLKEGFSVLFHCVLTFTYSLSSFLYVHLSFLFYFSFLASSHGTWES